MSSKLETVEFSDIGQNLKSAENILRTLIVFELNRLYGADWISKCGVTEERINNWKRAQDEEFKRLGTVDERLIYFSDFYDLKTILTKNWDKFAKVFGKLNKFDVLFSILEGFRNPDAHRRELLPYQKHLIIGISGQLRTDVTKYFSKMETGDSYFPRIESVQDSLGNTWAPDGLINLLYITKKTLRPGDIIEFTIAGFDPLGEELFYSIAKGMGSYNYGANGRNAITVNNSDIGKSFIVNIAIHSSRDYHASANHDDNIMFSYTVLPKL